MKARLDLPEAHARALTVILERVPPEEIRWALTGSGSLRLQGVDLPVHDLDIQTEVGSVHLIEQRLADFMKTPVHLWESPHMRSLDGKAEIEGVEVELLAEVAHRLADTSWGPLVDFSRLVWVDWREVRVPVFPLEEEAAAYAVMGRSKKAELIRRTLAQLKETAHD